MRRYVAADGEADSTCHLPAQSALGVLLPRYLLLMGVPLAPSSLWSQCSCESTKRHHSPCTIRTRLEPVCVACSVR